MLVQARVDGDHLLVQLPGRLAFAARQRTLNVSLEPVAEVRVEPSWWRALRIGAPGRHYRFRPGRWCAGQLRHARGRDFVALMENHPALVIDFDHWQSPYVRLALSVGNPHGLAALLRDRAGRLGGTPADDAPCDAN
ncbi:hypothetical protein [Streptomyces mexicanus]|uniref:Uncharacterized protein n=1 Tax=Streptomyces mexicanus TaxID=178566 RepID=A0A7X1LSU5_9ACTN|nr:hypothetical protein [Streptomyces mexicanus]MBC2868585.1 hypothetical protein [Streptomyces mexicanus]